MLTPTTKIAQKSLFFPLSYTLDLRNQLYVLSHKVDWAMFGWEFPPSYCHTTGALAKLIYRRAAIELAVGHLKSDHRLSRNHLNGDFSDAINVMFATAGFNLHNMMNKFRDFLHYFFCLMSTGLASLTRTNIDTQYVGLTSVYGDFKGCL